MHTADRVARQSCLQKLFRHASATRLSVVLGSFVIATILQLTGLLLAHSFALSAVFALPTLLAAWWFKWPGAALGMGTCLLVFVVVNTLFVGSVFWPLPLLLGFVSGSLMLLIGASLVGALRTVLDLAEHARQQAQKAEEQIALAYGRQQQLDVLKEHFLLQINHELRTPLTMVRGYLELLEEQIDRLDAATRHRMLALARLGCDELQSLIESVLQVAHVEQEGLHPQLQVVELRELVERVLTMLDPRSRQDHRIDLSGVPATLTVWADPEHVRHIVRNVLSNAFKYTPTQTLIRISATREAEEGSGLTADSPIMVCVRDEGPGIPAEQIPLLFHKFARLQRDVGGPISGSGLGLYLCQHLVQGMGGRIWIESAGVAGQGCRVCFTLPAVPTTHSPQQEAGSH